MAKPLTPDQLIRALDKWGVPYKLYPGWKTRARPGGCNPIGFVIHHTGGPFTESASYLNFLFNEGRPSERIPGPLCQFAIGPSGTVHVGSIGRANQAGRGSSATRDKIRTENYPGYSSEIRPGADNIDGNAIYWGVEICYPGTVPMRSPQYRSAVLLATALVDAFGWSALSVLAHREHSRRKGDPFGVRMDQFRRDVRARLTAGPGDETLPDTGGDDSMSAADVAKLENSLDAAVEAIAALIRGTSAENPALGNGPKATWNYYELPNPVTGDMEPIKDHVGYASKYGVLAYLRAAEGLKATAGVAAQVAAVQEMLAAQKGLTTADLDRIREAAQAGADAALEQRIEDARVELVVASEAAEAPES